MLMAQLSPYDNFQTCQPSTYPFFFKNENMSYVDSSSTYDMFALIELYCRHVQRVSSGM
jgi:hypothetical protein